jgi:hypothetical protein
MTAESNYRAAPGGDIDMTAQDGASFNFVQIDYSDFLMNWFAHSLQSHRSRFRIALAATT